MIEFGKHFPRYITYIKVNGEKIRGDCYPSLEAAAAECDSLAKNVRYVIEERESEDSVSEVYPTYTLGLTDAGRKRFHEWLRSDSVYGDRAIDVAACESEMLSRVEECYSSGEGLGWEISQTMSGRPEIFSPNEGDYEVIRINWGE